MNDQTPITEVMNIGVPVSNQDRALAFHTKKLGFETRRDVPLPQFGGRWIEVAPVGARITLSLVPAREGVPAGIETGIRLAAKDAAAVHAALQDRGVDVASCSAGRACRRCSSSTTRTATASRSSKPPDRVDRLNGRHLNGCAAGQARVAPWHENRMARTAWGSPLPALTPRAVTPRARRGGTRAPGRESPWPVRA